MTEAGEQNAVTEIDMGASKHLPARGEELMRVVTRFEFALKEGGYGRTRAGAVEADWDRFANEALKREFLERVRKMDLAPTILNKPPSKQILPGGFLDWKPMAPPMNIQDFVVAVRRVRNNLVHGGKSGEPDADRNVDLVAEAIEVLLEALRTQDDLRFRFEGRY